MSEDERQKQWEGMLVRLPNSFRQLCELVQTGEMDDASIGRIVSALILRDDSKLKGLEKAMVMVQRAEMERMADYLDRQKELKAERQRKWKERTASLKQTEETAGDGAETAGDGAETVRDGAETVRDGAETAGDGAETAGDGAETVRDDKDKGKDKDINRSVPFARARDPDRQPANERERNGNGTVDIFSNGTEDARKLVAQFVAAVRKDQSAFFDPEYDSVTVILAVTGDWKSARRWRQLVNSKGDDAVRQETYTFWREVTSGENVGNRGAALNARLAALPDAERS